HEPPVRLQAAVAARPREPQPAARRVQPLAHGLPVPARVLRASLLHPPAGDHRGPPLGEARAHRGLPHPPVPPVGSWLRQLLPSSVLLPSSRSLVLPAALALAGLLAEA